MQPKRNILIIVQNLPVPFDRRVWQEATSLHRAGFGVSVICPKTKAYSKSYERLEGVDIYRYRLIYEAGKGVAGYFVEFVYCWLASLWLACKAYLHRPFHAIHACNPPDTFFALAILFRPLGVKFVFDHHDLCPELYLAKGERPGGWAYRVLLALERLTFLSADVVIAVNQSYRAVAVERGKVDASKLVTIRSGPPRDWADQCAAEPSLKQNRKYLVVYHGVMGQQDGIEYLIRAIRHYADSYPKDTLFALIGGGTECQRMKEMVHQLGLEDWVCFTGRVPNEALWQYLTTADVCVDPDPFTVFNDLSTMNKIVECLAFGKPVVAFDLTEHRRTALDAAEYVEPNDDLKLCAAVRELLVDEKRRHEMGRYGQLRFREHLAWENSERELIKMYSTLFTAAKTSPVQTELHGATD